MKSLLNLQNPLQGLAIIQFAIIVLLFVGVLGVFTSCRTECDNVNAEIQVWVPIEVVRQNQNWNSAEVILIQSTCRQFQFNYESIVSLTPDLRGFRFAIHAPIGTTFRIWTRCDMVIPQYVTILGIGNTGNYLQWEIYEVRLELRPQYIEQ